MSRLWKVLPLALVIVGVGVFAASCGSSGTQYRVVNAIPDGPNGSSFDINVNGSTVFSALGFGSSYPNSGYKSISPGSVPIIVYLNQTTNPVISSTPLSLSSGSQYTVFLIGSYNGGGTSLAPAASLKTDNNTAPTSGNVEFRVVHASPSAQNFYTSGLDVYIVPPGTPITSVPKDISGLTFGQASSYVSKGAAPSASYDVVLTAAGSTVPLFAAPPNYSVTSGQIRTLVLVDVPGGGNLSSTPLLLNDLN